MKDYRDIKEVIEVCGENDVNAYLKQGWILLDVFPFQPFPERDNDLEAKYVLGKT